MDYGLIFGAMAAAATVGFVCGVSYTIGQVEKAFRDRAEPRELDLDKIAGEVVQGPPLSEQPDPGPISPDLR